MGPAPDMANTCDSDITDIRLLVTRPSISLGVSSCSRTWVGTIRNPTQDHQVSLGSRAREMANELRASDNTDAHQRADDAEQRRAPVQHVAHINCDQSEEAADGKHPGRQGNNDE